VIWAVLVGTSVGAGWLLGRGDAARLGWAGPEAPRAALLAALALTLGLYGRQRLRLRRDYASPTRAYLGKLVAMTSLAVGATFLFAPVDWPADALYGASTGVAAGGAMWLSNLPRRL